jgi:N-acetylated-alpha-linked acidic dipeptidase
MKGFSWRHSLGAALAVSYLFAVALPGEPQTSGAIRGFSRARVEKELQLEEKLQSVPDPAHAESDLRHLTSEPHMAGTEASHRVAEWLLAQYRSFGFDAEIVTYSAWLPQPREIKLELVAPQKLTLASPEQPIDGDPDTLDARVAPAFNSYSPSGEITAPVVYVNYGLRSDYRDLEALGVSVEGKIVIARYGHGFRGIKAKIAEEHKAAALIVYSDPEDDGYVLGDTYPRGPWRPLSGIQRGSVMYTQVYPGDPLTPDMAANPGAKRLPAATASDLPHIPTMPISAKDAAVILASLGGQHVPRGWQGGLAFTYHIGPGEVQAHMKLVIDYAPRPVYDVIAKLHGTNDDQWVVLGNHHDAWVFGAADPGSGTATMLETARAMGELARAGWKPRRTIVMCEWDAEEPGLIGSTEWVEANGAELQAKAVAYINADVAVTGPNFTASATPSLKELLYEITRAVQDPATGSTVYQAWLDHAGRPQELSPGLPKQSAGPDPPNEVPIGNLGAGSDFCPFFDHAGIPSIDLGFEGDYGVYHSLYDDFYWMKHFGDPTFVYHAALARVIGTLALRLDEADILPYDYPAYASEIARASTRAVARAAQIPSEESVLKPVTDASIQLTESAARESLAIRAISFQSLGPAKIAEVNRALSSVEQGLLAPEGLSGRSWYKHTVFAPGSYAGYAAEMLPGINESLDRNDPSALRIEVDSLAAALRRAAARLDEVSRLTQPPLDSSPLSGH